MKVLIVCSGNVPNFDIRIHQAFIHDQVEAIKYKDPNLHFDYFIIKGKGVWGYLKNLKLLKEQIKSNNYNIVHAHFALSGLLTNLQRKVPVVITFHGSDINNVKIRIVSHIVELLSLKTIYVSKKLQEISIGHNKLNSFVIPCGVDFNVFKPYESAALRSQIGLNGQMKYILFSSSFDNPVKNFSLLLDAVELITNYQIKIIELKNYQRHQVAELMSAVDVCVMTSFTEGSPQFIKEAMACNCPIVSTDVGDVKEVVGNIKGCFITNYKPIDVANKIKMALNLNERTQGRNAIQLFNNDIIAEKIINLYKSIIA